MPEERGAGTLSRCTGWGSWPRGPMGSWWPQQSVCLLGCREPRGDLGDGGVTAVGPVHTLPSTCLQKVEEQPEDADNQRNVTRMGSQPADPGAPVHIPAAPTGPPAEGTVVPSEYLPCVPVCAPLSCPWQLLGNRACLRVVPQLGRKPSAASTRALVALTARARGQHRHCHLPSERCVPAFCKSLQVAREVPRAVLGWPGLSPGAGPGLPSWPPHQEGSAQSAPGCGEAAAGPAGGRSGGRRGGGFPATTRPAPRPPGLCRALPFLLTHWRPCLGSHSVTHSVRCWHAAEQVLQLFSSLFAQ